jgi:uncharacterized protein with NRDE domain
MCSVILLRRPDDPWPVLIAANRDEMGDRPWDPPGRHWPDRPEVVAGHDRFAGGSWLGHNDHGVVAAVLNRESSLGPEQGKRSRGELVLEALDHADAVEAAAALKDIDPKAYRTFNLVVADNRDVYWVSRREDGRIYVEELPEGYSMLTSADLNDDRHPRIATYLPRFRASPAPDPDTGEWTAWREILARREPGEGLGVGRAMCIVTDYGFGTVSSSLMALAAPEPRAAADTKDLWLFSAGRPGTVPYEPVAL